MYMLVDVELHEYLMTFIPVHNEVLQQYVMILDFLMDSVDRR